ncbi:fructosamine kinase family protein [Streptomyces sp. NPDC006552]|uniref:fructosamine kinase family protein n=1 Tax=Streptomyces sp. NPDC006552 TaxID=3157179 RepID=UPI0033B19412
MSHPSVAAARHTGRRVVEARRRSSGLTEAVLDDGRVVMVKHADAPEALAAEAAGLRWLAAAGAVAVPTVHGHDAAWLVTDRVSEGRASAAGATRFGRELAVLHATGAPEFGAPPPGGPADAFIGRAPMRNEPGGDWPRWYAEHRMLPYVRLAVDSGTLRAAEAATLEKVAGLLPALAGPAEPPARLHGDLWNGNVLWGQDGDAWLIDPAAHGGHRETDLAMLHLFGAPHLNHILDGYQEAHPLADGWQGRVPLHQLFPLLVHTVLFGRGYAEQALAAARGQLAR